MSWKSFHHFNQSGYAQLVAECLAGCFGDQYWHGSVRLDVAARGQFQPGLGLARLDHAGVRGVHEAYGERHEIRVELGLGAGDLGHLPVALGVFVPLHQTVFDRPDAALIVADSTVERLQRSSKVPAPLST